MEDGIVKKQRIINEDYDLSLREREHRNKVIGINVKDKLPMQGCVKKNFGEHQPSAKAIIATAEHYLKTIHLTDEESTLFQRYLQYPHMYEKVGLEFGIFFSTIFFFLPGIRRLPIYYRAPISIGVLLFSVRCGKNYGEDLAWQRLIPAVEAIEREYGVRNYIYGY